MKIVDELLRVESVSFAEGGSESAVHFSAALKPLMDNVVFKAHFPGKPVVPGACLIGAAAELVADNVDSSWHLSVVKNVKYISLIEPNENTVIVMDFDVDKSAAKVKVVVSCDGIIATKMSLQCTTA